MAGKPDCPRCGSKEHVDIHKYNAIKKRVTWFCSKCRITWNTGGYRKG